MSSMEKTPNYNLSVFGDDDKPTFRGDISGDNRKIDTALYDNHVTGTKNTADIVDVKQDIKKIQDKNVSQDSDIDDVKQSVQNAQNTADSANASIDATKTRVSELAQEVSLKANRGESYTKTESDDKYALKSSVPNVVTTDNLMRIALFGDSWCTVSNNVFAKALESNSRIKYVRNYGVNGATIQGLSSQAETAKNDGTNKDEITDVVILIGTNNVYHDTPVSSSEAVSAFSSVRNLYPKARIHYFPDNSKTPNGGRNSRYATMLNAASSQNIATHREMLSALVTGTPDNNTLGSLYQGNDTFGVQHLTDDGYTWLAHEIAGVLDGGTFNTPTGNMKLPVTFDSNSSIKFQSNAENTNLSLEFIGFDMVHVYGVVGGVTWSGASNPKTFTVSFGVPNGLTGIVTPVNFSSQYHPLFLYGASDVVDNIGMSTGVRASSVGMWGNAPNKDNGWLFSNIAVDATYKAQYLV